MIGIFAKSGPHIIGVHVISALGFLLSAIVQSVVSRQAVAGALGQFDLRGVALASGLGAASSSCSYAAVAVGRTLFRKGAHFANAIIFEFASTNLVFELGLVLFVLLGWQFVGAELAGGLLMIARCNRADSVCSRASP